MDCGFCPVFQTIKSSVDVLYYLKPPTQPQHTHFYLQVATQPMRKNFNSCRNSDMPFEQLANHHTLFDVLIDTQVFQRHTVVLWNGREEVSRISPQVFAAGGLVGNAFICRHSFGSLDLESANCGSETKIWLAACYCFLLFCLRAQGCSYIFKWSKKICDI